LSSGFTIYALVGTAQSPEKQLYGYSGLVPSFQLFTTSCNHAEYVNVAITIVVNFLGEIVLFISTQLQQLCTSPSAVDIATELDKGDASFGANAPWRMFRRSGNRGVSFFWVFLVVSSLPLHLLLNGIFGYTRTILPWNGAAILSNETSLYITGQQLYWTNVSTDLCIQTLSQSYNTDVRNFSAVLNVDSPSMSKEMSGFPSPPNWNFNRSSSGLSVDEAETTSFALFFLVGGPNMTQVDETILYCLIEFVEPECGISARWLPSTIVTVTLVIKAIITIMFIRRSKHFQVRVYNNLGDVVDLSVRSLRYPEFGLLLATSNECNNVTVSEVKARRKRLPFIIIFGLLDYGVYVYFLLGLGMILSLCIHFRDPGLNQLGYFFADDSQASGNFFSLDTNWSLLQYQDFSTIDLLGAVMTANTLQLWISSSLLLVHNHITRMWQEWEWRRYSYKLQIPRTSFPGIAGTKSARRLQLPWFLAVFLMTAGLLLHWITSQAMSVVETTGSTVDNASYGGPGVSTAARSISLFVQILPIPMLVLASLWLLVLVVLTFFYLFPFRTWMPKLAGSVRTVLDACSSLNRELPKGGIKWGEISDPDEDPGRTGFSLEARPVIEGKVYLEKQWRRI
jgi:hypothetical protein